MRIKKKEIVLGISGGISSYKSTEILRGLRECGANVSVVMTKSATEFVQPLVFQALSERPVATSLFSLEQESKIGHIKLAENANAVVIAPATANIIAKAAHGLADDILSTTLLACKAPLFMAPAMNHHMWDHPAVQNNLNILKNRGAIVIPPESGFLACGSYGKGRMAAPETIVTILTRHFEDTSSPKESKPLTNRNVLVTAGPTQERIDAVRYLTNDSSGKMGYAIAECCRNLGATVCLVSGPTHLDPPKNIEVIRVKSAEEMHNAVRKKAESSQLIIKAAAVSDFRAEKPNPQKTKKTKTFELRLMENPDILKELGSQKRDDQYLVGFAAESHQIKKYAKKKLKEKNLDLVVANNILQPDAGFNGDTNRVTLIDESSDVQIPLQSKEEVADKILNHILSSKKWKKIITVN